MNVHLKKKIKVHKSLNNCLNKVMKIYLMEKYRVVSVDLQYSSKMPVTVVEMSINLNSSVSHLSQK